MITASSSAASSSKAARQLPIDPAWLSAVRGDLLRIFGEEITFSLWHLGDSWSLLAADGETAAPAPLPQVLEELDCGQGPRVLPVAPGHWSLAIPLPPHRRVQIAATTELACADPQLLGRLAQAYLNSFSLRQEGETLSQENRAFLQQVTNDFEELTFLRSMAELLEISDLSFDFRAMVERILPTLNSLCDADALALLTARPGDTTEDSQDVSIDAVEQWSGERTVDDTVCVALTAKYQQACQLQPIVKNNFQLSPEGDHFPGVNSFVLVPIASAKQTIGWLLALNRNNRNNLDAEDLPWRISSREFGTHEATLMSSTAAVIATHARNVELFREREELLIRMVRALVSAIEAKDQYTRGHSERVALYGKRLAEEIGLDAKRCERLYLTGLLHDVGKIGVRDAVLRKAGPLSDEEFEEIKEHPDKGWAILHDLIPLKYVLPGVLFHHEQPNGGGYPDQLSGDHIPLDGRILAVADAYDAMTSDRPYRPGMPQSQAEAILRSGAGDQWDAELIEAFFRAMPDIVHIKQTYSTRPSVRRRHGSLEVAED